MFFGNFKEFLKKCVKNQNLSEDLCQILMTLFLKGKHYLEMDGISSTKKIHYLIGS